MSLLLHQDEDEALLRVDGSRIDNDGRLQAYVQSPRSEFPSRPQTPSENAPKKKISLKDYKTKDKSAVNTPERKPIDDIRRQAIKSHKEEVDAKKEEEGVVRPKVEVKDGPRSPIKQSATPEVKQALKLSQVTVTQHDPESQRPAKKRRLSTDEDKHALKPANPANDIRKKEGLQERRTLPTLLSPDMPNPEPNPMKKKRRGLPNLLTPDLPPGLEKILSTAPHRGDDVKAILKASLGSPVRVQEKKGTEPARATSPGRVRSDSQISGKGTTPAIKVSSPIIKPHSAIASRVGTPLQNGRTASPKPRQRHIIVLRYGKKNRKRVEMLLKLSRQKKISAPIEEKGPSTAMKTPVKADVKANAPVKLERKRLAEPSPEPPSKKPKSITLPAEAPAKLDRPSTPKPDAGGKSPKLKSTFSTPKKDTLKEPRSIAMQRVASSDTFEAQTPSQDTIRTSTPLAVSHSSQPKTSPAPNSTSAKSEELVTWSDIQANIFQTGRALKKEGTRLANEGKGKEQEKGVILLIEGLLCFMLNAGAQAQLRPNTDPNWTSILPYQSMVRQQSKPYKHLQGLVTQLGAVVRQHLHHEHMRRLCKESLPVDDHNSIGSAPTPGSDGNTRTSEDPTEAKKSFLRLRDEIVQNSKDVRTAWLDGSRVLGLDVIEDQYPKTWGMRTKDTSKRNPDKIIAKDCGKALGFYLPMDVTTNVFEATNFALAFLHEWTLIEGVSWKTRVDLAGLGV